MTAHPIPNVSPGDLVRVVSVEPDGRLNVQPVQKLGWPHFEIDYAPRWARTTTTNGPDQMRVVIKPDHYPYEID